MPFDPQAAAGLVVREVRTGEREGAPTRLTVSRRLYQTDQADLWDAVTNPERLPRWFVPVSGDLSLGGQYQIEGNASGTVTACDEPRNFALTWEFGGQISWLTVTLSPADGGTRLEVVHEAPVDLEFWAQYGPGATGVGWDLSLLGLGWHLEGGVPEEGRDPDAFASTEPGIAFVRHAAMDWSDAAISDGDESGPAREAAENTVTGYTVPPVE